MPVNDWDNMPSAYHDHLAWCRCEDAGGFVPPGRKKREKVPKAPRVRMVIKGWMYTLHAYGLGVKKPAGIKSGWMFDLWISVSGKKKAKNNRGNKERMREYKLAHSVCEDCRSAKAVDVHHMAPLSLGGEDHPRNYRAVCLSCHSLWHPEKSKRFFTPTKRWCGHKVKGAAHAGTSFGENPMAGGEAVCGVGGERVWVQGEMMTGG